MKVALAPWTASRPRLLTLAAIWLFAGCGDDGGDSGGSLTHEDVLACLGDRGLTVAEGGRISGQPGITVEGGSVLVVVFDSPAEAESETEDPTGFFANGETDARRNAFVYFAPGASADTRDAVDSCVPLEGS